jgi:hypothetical protein
MARADFETIPQPTDFSHLRKLGIEVYNMRIKSREPTQAILELLHDARFHKSSGSPHLPPVMLRGGSIVKSIIKTAIKLNLSLLGDAVLLFSSGMKSWASIIRAQPG